MKNNTLNIIKNTVLALTAPVIMNSCGNATQSKEIHDETGKYVLVEDSVVLWTSKKDMRDAKIYDFSKENNHVTTLPKMPLGHPLGDIGHRENINDKDTLAQIAKEKMVSLMNLKK